MNLFINYCESPSRGNKVTYRVYIYIYIYIFVNFENLIIEFYVLYILNMHIKFH